MKRAIGLFVVAGVLGASPAVRAAGTWSVQSSDATSGVGIVCPADEKKAFAYGAKDDGQGNSVPLMLTTQNGGETWTSAQAQGATPSAMLILTDAVCTATKCYALAMSVDQSAGIDIRNNLITSSDGGATWFWPAKSQLTGRTYARIDLLSDSDIWLSSGDTTIRHSTDGGKSFVFRTPQVGDTKYMSIVDTAFLDAQTGFVANAKSTVDDKTKVETIAAEGALLKTTDGGTTWTTLFTGQTEMYDRLEMQSATNGWLAGHTNAGPFLRRTTDGGQTWTDVAIPASTATVSGGAIPAITSIDGLVMFDASNGLLVGNAPLGQDSAVHVIYDITNGVLQELIPDPLGNAGALGTLSCTSERTCFTGGTGGKILKYVDGSVQPADGTAGEDVAAGDRDGDNASTTDAVGGDAYVPQDLSGYWDTTGGGSGSGCTAGAIPGAGASIPAFLGLLALAAARLRRRD